jgi:hypothetical protein
MKKTIKLPCFGLTIQLGDPDPQRPGAFQGGKLLVGFERPTTVPLVVTNDEEYLREVDAALDALESLIVAHACAGIDVSSPAYVEGIETAYDAIDNND